MRLEIPLSALTPTAVKQLMKLETDWSRKPVKSYTTVEQASAAQTLHDRGELLLSESGFNERLPREREIVKAYLASKGLENKKTLLAIEHVPRTEINHPGIIVTNDSVKLLSSAQNSDLAKTTALSAEQERATKTAADDYSRRNAEEAANKHRRDAHAMIKAGKLVNRNIQNWRAIQRKLLAAYSLHAWGINEDGSVELRCI